MAGLAPGMPRALAGRYRLVRPLAKGGMAEVWEGRDEVLSRPVAVKMLLAHLAADPHLRERFRREAVTAARLVHPGIVATFDAGVAALGDPGDLPGSLLSAGWSRDDVSLELAWPSQPSTAFIVMELVPGETLRDLVARACPLPPDLAVAIAAQVTDALAYAHAQGLVHRDIKPANVLLRDEGAGLVRVKVADFGIAKAAAAAGADLTASGTVLGTPKYLAPEQVQGHEPDARADLYSLGVVLFEMLAGEPPFRATTDMATALAHVQQPAPRLDDVRPGLPAGLGELVDALLVKDPDRRVPSALVLGGALTAISKGLGVPAQAEPGAYLHIGPEAVGAEVPAVHGTAGGAGTWPSAAFRFDQESANLGQEGPAPETLGNAAPGRTAALPSNGTTDAPSSGNGSRSTKDRRRRAGIRRRHRRLAGILTGSLLLAGVLVTVALWRAQGPEGASHQSNHGSGGNVSTLSSSHSPVRVLAVHELTQDGNHPNDNLSELGNVIDGDPATSWESDIYASPNFGGSGGFGLVLKLGAAHTLHELAVTTSMQGWSAETFTSDVDAPELAAWGAPTADRSQIYGNATFSLQGRKASWVLLWITDPGPTRQAQVEEITVR